MRKRLCDVFSINTSSAILVQLNAQSISWMLNRIVIDPPFLGENSMQFMKLNDVMQITKLSRSSIYARMKEETFPQHFKIGKRAVAWTEESILSWMNSTITGN